MKRLIQRSDILSPQDYERTRVAHVQRLLEKKKHRTLQVGPDVVFYFENYDTMWFQVHEMLRIEKGGEPQIKDELDAYNPLIPQGHELIATAMIEIDDRIRRRRVLYELKDIEETIMLRFGSHTLQAVSIDDKNHRTTEDGKTSSVHFIRFPFLKEQKKAFLTPHQDIVLEITHPHYQHKALMSEPMREELATDFLLD